MENKIILSIVIPVYNVENYIKKCIESIVIDNKEFLENLEIIFVNDGSTDGSAAIIKEYVDIYKNIKLIDKKNEGVAAARNDGIKQAKGKWIYFMDSDDWMESHCLINIFNYKLDGNDILIFDANKIINKVKQNWEHFDNSISDFSSSYIKSLQRVCLYFPSISWDTNLRTNVPFAAPWDKIYNTEFLKSNNLFFNKQLLVLDDMVFNVEAFGLAKNVYYIKEKIYNYRFVTNSITNNYKKNRVELDIKVWEYLEQYIIKQKDILSEKQYKYLISAFYCRIIKSFAICCRLNFFNKKNKKTFSDKINYIQQVCKNKFYEKAFNDIDIKLCEWKLKILIIFIRNNFFWGVYLLNKLQNG